MISGNKKKYITLLLFFVFRPFINLVSLINDSEIFFFSLNTSFNINCFNSKAKHSTTKKNLILLSLSESFGCNCNQSHLQNVFYSHFPFHL